MSSEKDILALEDRRLAAMIARDFGALELLVHEQLLAWTRTPQGWKFVAWQSCPQPS